MLVIPVSGAYHRLVFLCFFAVYLCLIVIWQTYMSLSNASLPTLKAIEFKILLNLDVKFLPTWQGVGILARKNRLVMNWYSFLGQEYGFFNLIVSCLFTLETLKSQISFWVLPLKPHKGSALDPSRNYDCFAIAFSFTKLNLLPQNGH